ncbi:MAG: hypothetical protein ACLPX8_22100 [Bryobacteraceae bacterium]|jgi:hypothetical protein
MRVVAAIALLSWSPLVCRAAEKLTFQDRVELTRGLMAEYARAKVLVPRSRKPLEFDAQGTWDKQAWAGVAHQNGPAARLGDLIQITKVEIESDRLVLQLNGGFNGGRHWYSGAQVVGAMGNTVPLDQSDSNAPGGTTIAILFHKPLEPIKAAEIKKMLAPVLDFDKHSATEIYSENLPPEVQKAVKERHAREGMTREQVLLALGRPEHKWRETKDGTEFEDWVYGTAPGKISFVTFVGDKVVKVKEEYAGLGTIEPDRRDHF